MTCKQAPLCGCVFDKITEKEEFFGGGREMLGLSCVWLSQLVTLKPMLKVLAATCQGSTIQFTV